MKATNQNGDNLKHILDKVKSSIQITGGTALQIIFTKDSIPENPTIAEINFIDNSCLRHSQNGSKIYYSNNWKSNITPKTEYEPYEADSYSGVKILWIK